MSVAMNPGAGYTPMARFLHWVMAAIVIVMIPLGIAITNFEMGDFLYNLHKSLGFLVLPLAIWRLIYRLTNPPPPLVPGLPAIQRFAAHASHWTLYALLIIQPIIGWIATSAYPAPIPFFGLFNVPPIWPENNAFSEWLFGWHRRIGVLMGFLVLIHIGAALFHHFIRKDVTLMRMLRG